MTLIQTIGRRKRSTARVSMRAGEGTITANGRSFEDYFPSAIHRNLVTEPLKVAGQEESYDIALNLTGGGQAGQAGAARHAIARAMLEVDEEIRPALKSAGLLRRDPRKKESKKYGLKKARKAPQYSKR